LSLCSIIIVTHNNLALTKQCLDSLFSKTKYYPYEVIVVDAHSNDGTREYLASKPDVKSVPLEKNFPYSYSLNRGLEVAKGKFLCIMNNDIVIIQSDWLTILTENAIQDKEVGIVGPLFCNDASSYDNTPRSNRKHLPKFWTRTSPVKWGERTQLPRYIYPDGKERKILIGDSGITACTYVMGACLVARRELLDSVGHSMKSFSSLTMKQTIVFEHGKQAGKSSATPTPK